MKALRWINDVLAPYVMSWAGTLGSLSVAFGWFEPDGRLVAAVAFSALAFAASAYRSLRVIGDER